MEDKLLRKRERGKWEGKRKKKKKEGKKRGGRGAVADLDHVDSVIKAIKIFET